MRWICSANSVNVSTTRSGAPSTVADAIDPDAYRALDSTARLLTAISAPQADEIERLKMELLRVRFDEHTIRPARGDFPLSPNPRLVSVVDGKGRQFAPQRNAAELLPKDQAGSATLQDPLRPGESYAVTLVFDLPADVQEPRLLLASGDWQTQFLIGHENSFLHRKTLFGL